MKQMEAKVSGIARVQGFTDVYEVVLDVPDIYNTYTTSIASVKLYVGPSMIDVYKRLYMNEEKFSITLPG